MLTTEENEVNLKQEKMKKEKMWAGKEAETKGLVNTMLNLRTLGTITKKMVNLYFRVTEIKKYA